MPTEPRTPSALDDPVRLHLLHQVLEDDALLHGAFARITDALSAALRTPIALVSLVDAVDQHFVGNTGITGEAAGGTPLSHFFCQHVVERRARLLVKDARRDPLVRDNPAINDVGVVAYAGEPIAVRGHVLGSVCAIDHRPREWSTTDTDTLRRFADLVEYLIAGRLRTESQIITYETLTAEQSQIAEMSRRLQHALLAQSGVAGPYDIAVFYEPGSDRLLLGGDFVATALRNGDQLDFVIGDVSGHGPEAAALAVSLRASWRALRTVGVAHVELLRVLDQLAVEADLHATILLGSLGPDGTLQLTSAGHPPPIAVRRSGADELQLHPGSMLGLGLSLAGRSTSTHALGTDTLLAYTDGLVEGVVDGTRARFAVEGLLDAIGRYGPDPGVLFSVATEANGEALSDDVAMLRIAQLP